MKKVITYPDEREMRKILPKTKRLVELMWLKCTKGDTDAVCTIRINTPDPDEPNSINGYIRFEGGGLDSYYWLANNYVMHTEKDELVEPMEKQVDYFNTYLSGEDIEDEEEAETGNGSDDLEGRTRTLLDRSPRRDGRCVLCNGGLCRDAWISTKERLPEKEGYYLVAMLMPSGHNEQQVAIYDKAYGWSCRAPWAVTHWMRLPKYTGGLL